jgi:hypothetical protein
LIHKRAALDGGDLTGVNARVMQQEEVDDVHLGVSSSGCLRSGWICCRPAGCRR